MRKHWVRSKALALVSLREESFLGRNPIAPLKDVFVQTATYFQAQRTLRKFSAKVPFRFVKGKYEIKTVSNWLELEEVLRLRYDVFHREFMNKTYPLGVDVDPYDASADHLIIRDCETGRIVGTYRLLCSLYTKSFYSQTEFGADAFLAEPGVKVEMSRACIHRDYRTGAVMHLLWRGLMRYVGLVDAAFLFGCASVKTVDATQGAELYEFFRQKGAIGKDIQVTPLPAYHMDDFAPALATVEGLDDLKLRQVATQVPPLLSAYLKAGARICGVPAIDRVFRCLDFFTVLRISDISEAHARKYVIAPNVSVP